MAKSKCAGIVKSGKKAGKLKKGYRWKEGASCPTKALGLGKATGSARERVRKARSGGRVTEFHCKGIFKSGKKAGKLKPGFKFKKGARCPVRSKKR